MVPAGGAAQPSPWSTQKYSMRLFLGNGPKKNNGDSTWKSDSPVMGCPSSVATKLFGSINVPMESAQLRSSASVVPEPSRFEHSPLISATKSERPNGTVQS